MFDAQDRRGARGGVFLVLILAALWTAAPSRAAAAPSFRQTLDTHLAAIRDRDLEALVPTLTQGADLTMIAPNGLKFDTRQQFIDFHRGWFASKDEGRYEGEVVRVVESPAQGVALIRYRYSSRGADGQTQASVAWLTLTFALEGGRWGLVFDQNTAIRTEPPAK